MLRTGLDILQSEYDDRFGSAIFKPKLEELLLRQYKPSSGKYVRGIIEINKKLARKNALQHGIKLAELAYPVQAIHHSVFAIHLNLIFPIRSSLMLFDAELLLRIVPIQIAATKLLLHRLLFVETESGEQERPDCYDVFLNDHAAKSGSICGVFKLLSINLGLLGLACDPNLEKFFYFTTLEILWQFTQPFQNILRDTLKENNIALDLSLLFKARHVQRRIEDVPFRNSDLLERIYKLWDKSSPKPELIESWLQILSSVDYSNSRSQLGLLKFHGLAGINPVESFGNRKLSSVHEGLLYNALHMQLPMSLLTTEQFMHVFNDLQREASRAHPFYDGDDEFPWYYFFHLETNAEKIKVRVSLRELEKSSNEAASFSDLKVVSAEQLAGNYIAPNLGPISLLELPAQYPMPISGMPLRRFDSSATSVISEPAEGVVDDFLRPWYTIAEANQSLGARRFE